MSGRPTPTERAADRASRLRETQRATEVPNDRRNLKPLVASVGAVAVLLGGAFVLDASKSDPPRPQAATPTPSASAPAGIEPSVVPTTAASSSPAQLWRDAALKDLQPLTGLVVNLGQGIASWQAGKTTDADQAAALDRFLISLAEARTAIESQAPLPAAPRAAEDFRLTAVLYENATRVARVATEVPKGPLRSQLQRQFARLRNLGDRYFDQADAELLPLVGPKRQIEGVTIVPATEVPDWRAIGLAAGPPLAAQSAKTTPRTYQDARPEQSFAAWSATVTRAAVPTDERLATALTAGNGKDLAALANDFLAASDALYLAADPNGERIVSTRLQLGLLVDSDAALAGEAATLSSGTSRTALLTVARDLARSADVTWDKRLGPRAFPTS